MKFELIIDVDNVGSFEEFIIDRLKELIAKIDKGRNHGAIWDINGKSIGYYLIQD